MQRIVCLILQEKLPRRQEARVLKRRLDDGRAAHDRMIPPGPTTQGKSATVSSRGNVLVWGSTEPTTWTSVAVLSGAIDPTSV
jgi:hypothetical protein